jgi:hypothetical protein
MSLINDALKRATKAQAATPPTPEPELEPAPPHRAVGIPGYFMPVMLCVLSVACWMFFKGWNGGQMPGLAGVKQLIKPEAIVAQAREPDMEMPTTEGVELPVPQNREFALNDSPSASPATTTEPASAASAPAVASVVPSETESSVTYKLQGIIYRPSNPSAVVNTRTVFIGDTVGNARVRSITERSVTLEVGGETKVLTMQ